MTTPTPAETTSTASIEAQRRHRQRSKGLARAYKRMDSKRALSSSKLQAPLSPIKETKPKLTSSSSHRSILSITELIDYDEGSLHDSILGDDVSECSEISFDGSNSSFGEDDIHKGSKAPKKTASGDDDIPPELLMEDPSLATGAGKRWAAEGMKKTPSGRWTTSSSTLTRSDSWTSVNSFISTSGDSVDTFVLSKASRLI